jgi:hypothetical protein
MNEYIVPVNNEALSRALVAVAGEEQAAQIIKAYQAIDAAMAFGHAQGIKAAPPKDEETSFKAGYDAGFKEASIGFQLYNEAYDDGYVDGVSDARSNPSYADEVVADLCSEDEVDDYDHQADLDGFDGNTCDPTDGDWYHDWDPIPGYEPKEPSDGAIYSKIRARDYEPRDKTVYDEPVTKSFLG